MFLVGLPNVYLSAYRLRRRMRVYVEQLLDSNIFHDVQLQHPDVISVPTA